MKDNMTNMPSTTWAESMNSCIADVAKWAESKIKLIKDKKNEYSKS